MPLLKGTFAASSGGIPVWNTAAGSIGTVYDIERSSKSFSLSASDPDLGSLTYSLLAGSLPTGLSLGSGGIISGTASSVVSDTTSTFTVRVQNATNYADRQFSITIKAQVRTAYSLNAGALQSFSVPSGLSRLNFKSWAGGGGGGTSTTGGSGAYQSGTFSLSSNTSSLSVYVPDGGKYVAAGGTVQYSPGFFPWGTTVHYAPGYAGSGGGGGGAALIDTSNNIYYAITGAGGGGSGTYASGGHGGPGGGDYGLRGYGTTPGEGGGTNVGGKSFFDMYENENLVRNNSFTNDISDWGTYLAVSGWQSTGGAFGAGCGTITWNGANDVGGIYTGQFINISPNTNYSIGAYVKGSSGTVPIFIGFEFFTSSSTPIGSPNPIDTASSTATVSPGGPWTQIKASATAPSNAAYGRIIIYKTGGTGVANDKILVDGVTWYSGGTTYLPFFNGSTSNLAPNPSFASDASSWTAVNGSSGQRITTDYYQGQTACYQLTTGSSDYAGIQAANISITGGNYYSLGAYIKNVSGLATRQMYAQFAWFNSGGGLISYSAGTPITVTDQWTRVICNAVAPSNATMCYIFVQYANGVQAGWVTKIDAITLYNADGQLPYSDGSNQVFSWSGTTNNSSSYMRVGAAVNGSLYYGGNGSNSYTGSSNGGGAGGHGYYGGAGGLAGGAGGGSSWINPTYLISGTRVTSSGTLNTAPNTADSDYASGVAVGGGTSSQGGSGRIVIYY